MIITAAEVAPILGIAATDAELIRLVKSTDSWLKQRLGRQFERKTYTLNPRGYGSSVIFLRESPIRAITEIRIDPLGQFTDSTVADLSLFTFNPDPVDDDCKLTFSGFGWWGFEPIGGRGRWWWPFPELSNAIKVTGEFGWWAADDPDHDTDLPEDLREKAIERVVAKYKRGGDEEMQSERQGGYSYSKFKETDARILSDLRLYKR